MGAPSPHHAQSPKPPPTADHKGSTDMNDIDFDKAGMLLTIMEKCATVGPMMTSIAGEAGHELKEINEQCHQNALERAKVARENEQLAAQQKLEAETVDDKPEESVEELPDTPVVGRRV